MYCQAGQTPSLHPSSGTKPRILLAAGAIDIAGDGHLAG
jgi:hypothetical protein